METKSSTTNENLISFAKIAAMSRHKSQASVPDDGKGPQPALIHADAESRGCEGILPDQDRPGNAQRDIPAINRDVDRLSQTVQGVHLAGKKYRENTDVSDDTQENGVLKRETSFEDDRTHLSNSSTKPTSFDSKSMASTTFAMDEKDSLRPDDSASVQAIDEEESLSGPASGAPNSLTGSETGARGLRDNLRDVNPYRPRGILQHQTPVVNDGNPQANGAIPPDSVANNFVVPNQGSLQDDRAIHGFPPEPDEKLLEAMKSPKDRLLILQLEDKVRHFIQKSKEQSLELPPSNAFGRLLAHKLGDYYHLTHFVDNNVTSVRLHRTPFCRLPTPLSALHAVNSSTPPQAMPAMKIMRRNEGERPTTSGSTATSSKAASEAGDENDGDRTGSSAGATPAKDRMIQTREEREAKYNEVRERIFRDFPESRSDNSSGDQGNISRSSSASGRKKPQRQKTPHDDSFEVRSQYNAYYPGMHYASGPVPYQVAMNDPAVPNQPPFMVGPGATPPGTGHTPNPQNGPMYPGHMHGVPQYPMAASPQMPPAGPWQGGSVPQQPQFSGYPSLGSPAMMSQPPSAKSPPALNNYGAPNAMQYPPTNWPSPPYHGSFQQSPHRNQTPTHWPNYPNQQLGTSPTSYPYPQFPGQPMNPGVPSSPHALPGSFNRTLFNPQTRSFVPGGAPLARHPNRGNHLGMNTYQGMPPGPPQWTGFQDTRSQEPSGYSSHYAGRGAPFGNRDSIAKWGTPSHLPPKPPPSEVPSDFAIKQGNASLSASTYGGAASTKTGPFVVSGGTSLPKNS